MKLIKKLNSAAIEIYMENNHKINYILVLKDYSKNDEFANVMLKLGYNGNEKQVLDSTCLNGFNDAYDVAMLIKEAFEAFKGEYDKGMLFELGFKLKSEMRA
jgi:hypothetical protein